jgi:hypothetical protein
LTFPTARRRLALRGGGGSFGVVTAIELELFPLIRAYAGILWYPIERGGEVLHAWRDLTESDLPDELTTVGRFLNLRPIPEIPSPSVASRSRSSRPTTSATRRTPTTYSRRCW